MKLFGRSVVMGLGLAIGFAVIAAVFMTGNQLIAEQQAEATATAVTMARATALEQRAVIERPTGTAEAIGTETTRQAAGTRLVVLAAEGQQIKARIAGSDATITAIRANSDATMTAITERSRATRDARSTQFSATMGVLTR